MSQLGGFNFVFQIRRDKLLDLIQQNLTVQGKSLITPFRLSLQGPASGLPPRPVNSVDLLVKSVDLALQVGTNFCTLILHLEGGVIRLPDAPEAVFFGGDVNIRLQLLDGTFIMARLLEATLNAPANPVIAGIPDFVSRANREVNKLIDTERNNDVDVYPDAGFAKQIFVLRTDNRNLDQETFCISFGAGDAAQITPSLTSKNSISYGISASTITALLPTAQTLSRSPVTVTRVSYEFRHDFINVDGEFDAEDTCWSIDGGTFTQRLIPLLVSQNIVITPEPPAPEISCTIDIGFLCQLGMLIITLLNEIIDPMALLYGPTWLKTLGVHGAVVPNTPGQSQPALALGGVTWNQLVVSPEGFVLLGDRTGSAVVSAVQQPAIHIRTNDEPQNLHGVGKGSATVQAPTCEPQTFEYEESIQDDQNTLSVDAEWLFEPIEYSWTVNGNPLLALSPGAAAGVGTGKMSELEFTGTVTMALPPPNGTAISGHTIKLLYRIAGRTLLLVARNEDANYDIRVEVRATDALGRVFTDAVNLTMVGDIAKFGPDYDDYLDRCLKAAADLVNKKGQKQGKAKPGEPQESWRNLFEAMTRQVLEGNAEAAAMIPSLTRTLGTQVVSKALVGKILGGSSRSKQ